MWSRVFFEPSLQPMSHSPHSRQVNRVRPWMLPYSGSGMTCFGSGSPPGGAKVTASGGANASAPMRSAASRSARALVRSGYGDGVGVSIASTAS